MTCFSSKWILSHSTWYKSRRSGQGDADIIQEHPKMLIKMLEVVYGKPPDFCQIKRDSGGVPTPLLRSFLGIATSDDPEPKRKILPFQRKAY
jgi:hypothetical protein